MLVRNLLGSLRRQAVLAVNRRPLSLTIRNPVVSFTFDDFPQSAVSAGGGILKSYGLRGTFYAAMGLMGGTNELGLQFCARDLDDLLQDGHELGSHTFRHVSCRMLTLRQFEADVWRGRRAVEQFTGASSAHHFSYPYGHVTQRAKGRIGACLSSCRGIIPGVNVSPMDLNLLRANSLYSGRIDLKAIDRLLAVSEERGGWLIFYTHDISPSPSAYGCTPTEFESVVQLALKRNSEVLPVGDVIARSSAFVPRVRTGRSRSSCDQAKAEGVMRRGAGQ